MYGERLGTKQSKPAVKNFLYSHTQEFEQP